MQLIGICATLTMFTVLSVAQTPAPLEFEVASVKPASGSGPVVRKGGPGTADPERIALDNQTLRRLLMFATGVESDQISGPPWIDSNRYAIAAKVPPQTTPEQFQTMLLNLLKERFKTTLHHETKEYPVYELSVAKEGAKLTSAAALNH